MLLLIKNHGEILEPSCENARLFYCAAIEINAKCLEYHFLIMRRRTPYVHHRNILNPTKGKISQIFDKFTRVYKLKIWMNLFWINVCKVRIIEGLR